MWNFPSEEGAGGDSSLSFGISLISSLSSSFIRFFRSLDSAFFSKSDSGFSLGDNTGLNKEEDEEELADFLKIDHPLPRVLFAFLVSK